MFNYQMLCPCLIKSPCLDMPGGFPIGQKIIVSKFQVTTSREYNVGILLVWKKKQQDIGGFPKTEVTPSHQMHK